jgi:hypothetical protein
LQEVRRQRTTSSELPVVMSWIWINFPLAILLLAFAVGLPLWVTLKFPEDGSSATTQKARKPSEESRVSLLSGNAHVNARREPELNPV